MSERTDHAAEAQLIIAHTEGKELNRAAVMLTQAQVHATLALTEQQRIANLIELSKRGYMLEDPLAELGNEAANALVYVDATTGSQINGPDDIFQVRDDIKKRLGL